MNLYTSEQVYELDRLTIANDKQPGKILMAKAADAVWQQIQSRWSDKNRIVIFAGSGNNGGDAFALANQAQCANYDVTVYALGDLSRQSAESCYYRLLWEQNGGITETWQEQELEADIIVDGLLGIGLSKVLDEHWQSLIATINSHAAIKVAIDIPSGLNANTGRAMPCAIESDITVSFIGRKLGCYLADGPDFCGERIFADLAVSQSTENRVDAIAYVLDTHNIHLPHRRKNNSFKNQYGHVLIIGGAPGMVGAVQLSGISALRCGAGLVSLCVHPDNFVAAASSHAELMVSTWDELAEQLKRASVVLIGPGLGRCADAKALLESIKGQDLPMVIDADALQSDFIEVIKSSHVVLTPHPGEMARLLGTTADAIQTDRVNALQTITQRWQHTCILKGAGTLIAQGEEQLAVCLNGHAGMATAGMGDVLAGMTAGYLALGLAPIEAAQTAVFIHALAADLFAQEQEGDCLIATDIVERIASVMKMVRLDQIAH